MVWVVLAIIIIICITILGVVFIGCCSDNQVWIFDRAGEYENRKLIIELNKKIYKLEQELEKTKNGHTN